jgi:hypothetical protein
MVLTRTRSPVFPVWNGSSICTKSLLNQARNSPPREIVSGPGCMPSRDLSVRGGAMLRVRLRICGHERFYLQANRRALAAAGDGLELGPGQPGD